MSRHDTPPAVPEEAEARPAPDAVVVILRGHPVILDARVAAAFGVETREINQAVARNPHKFTDRHVFVLNADERDFLISQGVIPKPGRGGSRAMPHVYTQKGVARLATVLETDQALAATDLMIDLFVEVYQQIAQGRQQLSLARPGRLQADGAIAGQIEAIRRKLVDAMTDLLNTEINPRSKSTVADEIGDLADGALGFARAHLQAKGIENEKMAAETVHILEKAREIRDRTRADVAKSHAETERIMLENFEKKLAIVERIWGMAERFEPNAVLQLSSAFVRPALLLQAPSPSPEPPSPEVED